MHGLQTPNVKPLMRGVLHQHAFTASLVVGAILIATASTAKVRLAAIVFAVSVSALLGVSALYHRVNWSEDVRMRLRRLDHSMIFLLIAGTYTPFALLVLQGTLSTVVLAVVWSGAIAGSLMEIAWVDSPKWVMAAVCIALGWISVIALPDIAREIGTTATILLAVGGLFYTAGAVIYATQRPNPVPGIFGYHEVFHLLVVVAIALQYSVIAFFVIPN